MIEIKLSSNENILGFNENDIINKLAKQDWTEYKNKSEYMKNMTRRIKIYFNEKIKYKNDTEFINELVRIGFIKHIQYL